MTTVELRCPVDPRKMFARLHLDPEVRIVPGNLIEFACRWCTRSADGRVLHRYDITGQLVETAVDGVIP